MPFKTLTQTPELVKEMQGVQENVKKDPRLKEYTRTKSVYSPTYTNVYCSPVQNGDDPERNVQAPFMHS